MNKKMNCENLVCQINFEENFKYSGELANEYCKEAVEYAIARVFTKSHEISKICTNISWRKRLAKGKNRKARQFAFVLPANYMELPGSNVLVKGFIDAKGVNVTYAEISAEAEVYTCFM